tara:strand:- start:1455 stop:1859 length:405 start_codon:yes stop_codon:yes gene_type:complete
MPCAKLNLTKDICPYFKRKVNDNYVYFTACKLIVPVVSLKTSIPFRPKGNIIAEIIVYCDSFKKIEKKKFQNIIKKYNLLFSTEYICDNNKNSIESMLFDEIEMFLRYIGIVMKWDNFDNYNIFIKKKDYWNYF